MFQAEGTAWLGNMCAAKEEGRKCMVRESWGLWQANKGCAVTLDAGSHRRAAASMKKSAAENACLCAGAGRWEQVF